MSWSYCQRSCESLTCFFLFLDQFSSQNPSNNVKQIFLIVENDFGNVYDKIKFEIRLTNWMNRIENGNFIIDRTKVVKHALSIDSCLIRTVNPANAIELKAKAALPPSCDGSVADTPVFDHFWVQQISGL